MFSLSRKLFFTIARDSREYERDVIPTEDLLEKCRKGGADVLIILERKWCSTIPNPSDSWAKTQDNIALLHITTYDAWLKAVGKKTRNMIRKAEKSGIETKVVEQSEKLAEGIWQIYNETPIRQDRGFPEYELPLKIVKASILASQNSTYIGAYFQDELVGFIQLVHGENIARIANILSLQKQWDKAVNNALIAKAVEVCSNTNTQWLMYARMGNHPTLDSFKQKNGFTRFELTRYYVPLTRRGRIAVRLGLHKDLKDSLPQPLKQLLIPFYNWISRNRMRARLFFR